MLDVGRGPKPKTGAGRSPAFFRARKRAFPPFAANLLLWSSVCFLLRFKNPCWFPTDADPADPAPYERILFRFSILQHDATLRV